MSLFLFKLAYHNAFFALCLVINEWLFEFWMLAQKFRKNWWNCFEGTKHLKIKNGVSPTLCHCREGWLLGWRLWPGGKVLALTPQEQWSLLPPSQGLFLCCLSSQALDLVLCLPEFCPGWDGQVCWRAGTTRAGFVGSQGGPHKGTSSCCMS